MWTFNISQTHVDKNYPWTGILTAAVFSILSTTNRKNGYSPGQLIYGRDMILLIKHTVDWELIRQLKQTQINKDNIHKNIHRVDHDYKVGDNVMITKHTEYKYETPYTSPFVTTQCFTNGVVKLQNGATQIMYNIHHIKPYKSDTKVEDHSSKNMYDDVNIGITSRILMS